MGERWQVKGDAVSQGDLDLLKVELTLSTKTELERQKSGRCTGSGTCYGFYSVRYCVCNSIVCMKAFCQNMNLDQNQESFIKNKRKDGLSYELD